MVLSVSMAVVSISYLFWQRTGKTASTTAPFFSAQQDWSGIVFAGIAGISLAMANIFLAYSYKSGGGAGLVAILQNGFSISITLLIGVLFLHEVIRPQQMLGIALAMAGIFLIVKP
jgi:drug/metabolite transporter (DMT)-like permease